MRKLEILLKGARKRGNQKVIDEFTPMLDQINHGEVTPC